MSELTTNKLIAWQSTAIVDPRLEKIVGADNFQNPWFLQEGARLCKAVGLIPNSGTAFLIARDLLMTNWHIFRRPEWAKEKSVVFDVEQDRNGLPIQVETIALDPDGFFFSDESLDFSVVKVRGSPGTSRGFIDIQQGAELSADTRVNIIQHPEAGFKKIAIRDNGLKVFDDQILQYWTDTEHGSSGSPLFNDRWEIIGLHYMQDSAPEVSATKIYYNQGHRIAKIAEKLLSSHPGLL